LRDLVNLEEMEGSKFSLAEDPTNNILISTNSMMILICMLMTKIYKEKETRPKVKSTNNSKIWALA
jgi:hypothetical protein